VNKLKDYTGQVFDRLTALEHEGQRNNHTFWKLQCKCGEVVSRAIQSVKTNKYNACPNCRKGSGSHAWKGFQKIPKDVFNTIRHGAKAKDLPFEVSIEYLWKLYESQHGKCALTGWPIDFNASYKDKCSKTASLDRIDSSRGYVKGNLQWVHRDVNKLKKNIPNNTFISICQAVAKKAKCRKINYPIEKYASLYPSTKRG